MKDLQTSYIVDHEFIAANRVPDADELEADAAIVAANAQKIADEINAFGGDAIAV